MQNWWREYFTFNTGERRAIIAIVLGTAIIVAAINGYRYYTAQQNKPAAYTQNVNAFMAAYNAEAGGEQTDTDKQYVSTYKDTASNGPGIQATLFKFDPNTIGITEWLKLGFSEKQAASIEKYKAKGGTFYKVEDVKKLYVVSDDDYNRIAPYVEIKENIAAVNVAVGQLDLNKADSTSLEALPGIGALLTHRILERRKQGKYESVEELRNVKGMSEENYLKVAPHLKVR